MQVSDPRVHEDNVYIYIILYISFERFVHVHTCLQCVFGSNIFAVRCGAIVRGSRPFQLFMSVNQQLLPKMFEASAPSSTKPAPASEVEFYCVQCKEPTAVETSVAVFKDRRTGVYSRRCSQCNTANAKIGRIPNPAIRNTYWKMNKDGRVPLVCNQEIHTMFPRLHHMYNASLY